MHIKVFVYTDIRISIDEYMQTITVKKIFAKYIIFILEEFIK